MDLKDKSYEVNVKEEKELNNIEFTPFYNDYIFIPNLKAYKDFEFIETKSRENLFCDLLVFLTSKMNFLAICGHSGSGKTTSLLYFINQNREHYNIFYINCFTLSRKDLNNEKIKHILIEELRMAVNNGVGIVNKFILYLDEVFQKRNKSDNNFIYGIIKKIIDIYNDETLRKKLNIVIDQYSSKYDEKNENIFLLLNQLKHKGNKIRIILISSMDDISVANNLKKTTLSYDQTYFGDKFINYHLYGQLFNISDVISKEDTEIRNIMKEEFSNSALIYYKLKSKLLEEDFSDEIHKNEVI